MSKQVKSYYTTQTFVPSSVFLFLFAESHFPDVAPFSARKTNHVSPSSVPQVSAPIAATSSTHTIQDTHQNTT